jgi:NitT/TauT family transport system permease protein
MLQGQDHGDSEEVIVSEPKGAASESRVRESRESSMANRETSSTAALLALPAAATVALIVHLLLAKNEAPLESSSYTRFLVTFLVIEVVATAIQSRWSRLRKALLRVRPLFTAGLLLVCLWEIITAGLHLLPLPYFPGPASVMQSMINDRALLFDSTWHSLALLLGGYSLGVIAGLVSGVCIGWSGSARYWGMPLLKVVGPVPATAWIPLAMVVFPSATISAAALIALAVWFPVTMLTASGVSNTRASYLDVARTLGANERYLIFRVAIPAALPSIFVGLFMGLGASFLTLVVAESVGVKSGLGWYVSWAQGWAEYGKVFAALVIMAAFFSTIMTLLFKVRDRVLVWQKGMIRW